MLGFMNGPAEMDECESPEDDEPSLCGLTVQSGSSHDLEESCDDEGHTDSGIADLDGLNEQVGGQLGEVL